jgi:outer membrane receptor for ferric coprogen and ferric-rhodotorulic acid
MMRSGFSKPERFKNENNKQSQKYHDQTPQREENMPALHDLTPLSRTLIFRHVFASHSLPAIGFALALPCMQVQAQEFEFNIPTQSLIRAIQEFGMQANFQILYNPRDLEGLRSKELVGNYSPNQAIHQLLEGTGLHYDVQGSTISISIKLSSAIELSSTTVTGTSTTTTEGTGSYTTKSMNTATKLPLSIRETPQSITVVTRQQIEDQGLSTINDVAMKTPGLTMQKVGSERYNLYARSLPIDSIMYDGLPSTLDAAADAISPANLAMYDHIEIVRGANGLVQGSGNPSAAINLVRKRPTSKPQASVSLSAGSWDNYRSELDVSGPLLEDGKLRGRAVATYQDGNSFQDNLSKEHSLFYAIGEADITNSTVFTVSYSHQNENNNVAWGGGLPTAVDGSDLHLSRSTSYLTDWDYWDKETDALFMEIKHEFENGWSLRVSGNRTWSKLDYVGGYPGRLASNLNTLSYRVSGAVCDDTQSSYDGYVSGPFELFDRTHEFVFGYSYREDDYHSNGSGTTAVAIISDPGSFDSSSWIKPNVNINTYNDDREMNQEGVYASTRLSLTDKLKFIVGARLDWYDYEYIYNWQGDISYTEAKETRHPTRYAGLLYDLDQWHTLYTSYTDIFQPQSSRNASAQLLDPIKGENYEIGIKGEYFDGTLNTSLAVFQIDQINRAKEVDDPTTCSTYPSSTCYEATGKVRSRGIEVEVNGAVTPNWQLGAGYTFAEAKYKKDSDPTNEGKIFDTDIPRHQFKAFTLYNLPGKLNQWHIGGSFYYQSSVYNKGTTSGRNWKIQQDAYSVTDLVVKYKASEHLDVRFALNNLLDEKYYQSIGQNITSWPTTFYGAPRNFQVSGTYRF